MNRKALIILIAILAIAPQEAFCQWRLNARIVSVDGQCDYIFVIAMESMVKYNNGMILYNEEDCISARWNIVGANTYGNCSVNVIATCTNLSDISSNGTNNPFGYTQGQSFYSSNPANEQRDWDNQNEELMKLYGAWKEDYRNHDFYHHEPFAQTPHIQHFINFKSPKKDNNSDGLSPHAIPVTQFEEGPRMPTDKDLVDYEEYEQWSHVTPWRPSTEEPGPRDYTDDKIINGVDFFAELATACTGYIPNPQIQFVTPFAINTIAEAVKAGYILKNGDPVDISASFDNIMTKSVPSVFSNLATQPIQGLEESVNKKAPISKNTNNALTTLNLMNIIRKRIMARLDGE